MLASCLDRLNIDFYSQLSPPITKKMLVLQWFLYIPNIIWVLKLRSIFHSILVPTWLHFPSQNPWKSDRRAMSKHIIFFNRFLHQMFNGLGFLLGAYVGLCRALCCPFFPCVDPFFDFFAGDSWGFPLGPCPGMVFSSIFTCSLFCFAPQLVLGVVRWLLNRYTLRSRTKAQYPTVLWVA